MLVQSHYQEAIKYAANRHLEKNQKVKGTRLPYVVHLSNVAMEIFMAASHTDDFNLDFAVQVALLHDLLEDTSATYQEIKEKFGEDIAVAVLALSKNDKLPAEQQTIDSLTRIRQLSNEVWAVKLADRITNLQTPPGNWSKKKISGYREESGLILHALKKGNRYLAERLKEEIRAYAKYT